MAVLRLSKWILAPLDLIIFVVILVRFSLQNMQPISWDLFNHTKAEHFIYGYEDTLAQNNFQLQGVPPIVYIKTHKTGSETASNIMHRISDIRNLSYMVPLKPGSGVKLGWPLDFPGVSNTEYQLGSIDMIADHLVFDRARIDQYMKAGAYIWTTVRNPLTEAVSAYNYFAFYTINRNITWEEHIEWIHSLGDVSTFKALRFCNSMSYDLGWYNHNPHKTRMHDHNQFKISEFLKTLRRDTKLIVPLENFDQGLILLSYHWNISYHEFVYTKINAATNHHSVYPDDSLLPMLEDALSVDMAMYRYFFEIFEKKWVYACKEVLDMHVLDSSVELLENRLEHLQQMNTELSSLCALEAPDVRCGDHFKVLTAEYNKHFRARAERSSYIGTDSNSSA